MILSIPASRDEPINSSQEHSSRHLQTPRSHVPLLLQQDPRLLQQDPRLLQQDPRLLQQEIRQINPVTAVLNVTLPRTALGPVALALTN